MTNKCLPFSLTPACARLLLEELESDRIRAQSYGGDCRIHRTELAGLLDTYADTKVYHSFTAEQLHELLGKASRGFNTYGTDMIMIDLGELRRLSTRKEVAALQR